MVGEVLTWEQIEDLYHGEWVLLEDPQSEENLQVLGGKLLCHSKSREEIGKKLLELRPKSSALVYVGSPPADSVFLL
ncbi:MAG TPA: hypothetical protein VF914_11835 [Chloroflexia bacterium]|jgi:hypothetical protein